MFQQLSSRNRKVCVLFAAKFLKWQIKTQSVIFSCHGRGILNKAIGFLTFLANSVKRKTIWRNFHAFLTGLNTVWLTPYPRGPPDPEPRSSSSTSGLPGKFSACDLLKGDNESLRLGREEATPDLGSDLILVEWCTLGVEVDCLLARPRPLAKLPLILDELVRVGVASLLFLERKLHSHSVKNMAPSWTRGELPEKWPKLVCVWPHPPSKMATPLKAVWVSAFVFSVKVGAAEFASRGEFVTLTIDVSGGGAPREDEGAELLRLLEAESRCDVATGFGDLLALGVDKSCRSRSEGLWTPSGASWNEEKKLSKHIFKHKVSLASPFRIEKKCIAKKHI